MSLHSSTVPRWICKQLDASSMSNANLYFIAIQLSDGLTYDRPPISLNTYGMFFGHSLRSTLLIHNYSDFLFQLCLIRSSFQRFLKTFSTIALAIVLDAVLGYHDGNFCDLYLGCRDAYHYYCRPYKVSLLTSPSSWVSGFYLLSERWVNNIYSLSYALVVGNV